MAFGSNDLDMKNIPKILLVDDKVQNLIALEALLAKLDVEPVRALSGQEALERVLENDFALALVDIQMPGMDGFELAELLHGNSETEHLPIIFVSAAYSGEAFQIKGVESGAIDFIEKPIVPQILIGKVRLFVELYKYRSELIEESFRGVVGVLSDGVMLVNASGEVLMANPMAIDTIGREYDKKIKRLVTVTQNNDGFKILELVGLDGQQRSVEVNKAPLKWHGEKVWAVSMRDVTERQETLKRLESMNKELNDLNAELKSFAYTVSHDLKAPLITIGGYVGLLERQLPKDEGSDASSFIEEIHNATKKMNTLLNHMLEYSRVGRIESPRTEVSISAVVASVIKTLHTHIETKQVKLVVHEPMPSLVGEEVRIEQLMQNLLENAIKYMGSQQQPKIEIGMSTLEDGSEALFIRDNGSGIDPKHHEQAFNLFSRVDTEQEGSGVGLALVKKIANHHGGKV